MLFSNSSVLNETLIRQEYPNLEQAAYFNTSSIALLPRRGLDAVNKYWNSLAHAYCENADEVHNKICKETRDEIAELLSCDPTEIAFTKNTCDGITQFARSFPFQKGDNVVTTDQEYPSNLYPWLSLEREGVEIRVVPYSGNGLSPEEIIGFCDGNTKVVALSSTFFCTGFRMDLKSISKLCHEKGIVLVVDSIQSLGRLRVKPKELGIDFLSNGGHKCLLGMKGSGFLYCSKELQPRLIPYTACRQSVVSWHRPPLERHLTDLNWRADAGRFESGNPNYIGILAMGKGISLINELGPERIEEHVLALEENLRRKLEAASIPTASRAKEARSGILFLNLPQHADEKIVKEKFLSHRIFATIREGYIRISIHFFNTEEDIDRLMKVLREIFETPGTITNKEETEWK